MEKPPQIAVLGGGIFVRTQYIPRLAEISHLFVLKSIWSRSQESANTTVELARKIFPDVECKWGEDGLDEIINDSSITAVAVVLAGQFQVEMSLRLLKAGKHVLQGDQIFNVKSAWFLHLLNKAPINILLPSTTTTPNTRTHTEELKYLKMERSWQLNFMKISSGNPEKDFGGWKLIKRKENGKISNK